MIVTKSLLQDFCNPNSLFLFNDKKVNNKDKCLPRYSAPHSTWHHICLEN